MVTRNLAYRIGVEGKEQVISAQREIADSAEANYRRSSAAAERAANQADAAIERARLKAREAAQYQPSPVAQRINDLTGVTGDSGKSVRASAAAFAEALATEERQVQALLAAINPLTAAQARFAEATDVAGGLLQRGAISVQQHAAAVELAARQYDEAAASAQRAEAAFATPAAGTSAIQARIAAITGLDRAELSAEASARAMEQAFIEDARAAAALKAQIDPLGAAIERVNQELREAQGLAARGAISDGELARAKEVLTARTNALHAAQMRGAGSSKMLSLAALDLTRQTADIAVTGLSGMNPFMILLQQGPQIADRLQMMKLEGVGVGAAFKEMGAQAGGLARMIPLAATGVGALTAAATAGFVIADRYATAQGKLANQLRYSGAAADVSAQRIQAVAEAQARASDVSVAAARDIATAMATVGRVSSNQLEPATDLAKKLSIALGVDLKTATDLLAGALANPTRGADQLNEKLRFLTASQLESIKAMDAHGDRAAAVDAILKQLDVTVGDASLRLGPFAKLGHDIADGFRDAGSSIAGFIARLLQVPSGDTVQRLTQVQTRLAQLRAQGTASANPLFAKYQKEEAELQQQIRNDAARTAQQARATQSQQLKGAFDGLSPSTSQIKAIQDRQSQLRSALADPVNGDRRLADAGVSRAQARDALIQGDAQIKQLRERAQHTDKHSESLARQAASQEVSARAALAVADAYMQSESAGRLAEARRKALTDATRKGIDADAQARREIALQAAEQVANAAKEASGLQLKADAQRAVNALVAEGKVRPEDAQRELQMQLALAEAVGTEGVAREKLIAVLEKQRAALTALGAAQAVANLLSQASAADDRITALKLEAQYAGDLTGEYERQAALLKVRQSADYRAAGDDDSGRKAKAELEAKALQEVDQQRATRQATYLEQSRQRYADQAQMARAELGLIGQGEAARARILSHLQREQELKAQGLDLADQEVQAILAQGDAMDALIAQLQRSNAEWEEFRGLGENIIDTVLDPQAWDDWGDIGKSVLQMVFAEMVKLSLANPLKNLFFGSELPTGAGWGGFLGQIIGGGRSGAANDNGDRGPLFGDGARPDGTFGLVDFGADEFRRSVLQLGDSGDRLVDGLDQVFQQNTSGGFMRTFADLLSRGAGGGGGGGWLGQIIGAATGALFGGGGSSAGVAADFGGAGSGSGVMFAASGTDFSPGGRTVVGEEGPELLDIPRGARIHNAAQTRKILTAAANDGGGTVVNLGGVHTTIEANGAGPREIDELRMQLADYERGLPSKILNTVNEGISRRRIVVNQ